MRDKWENNQKEKKNRVHKRENKKKKKKGLLLFQFFEIKILNPVMLQQLVHDVMCS